MEFIKNNGFSIVFTTLHKNPHSYINMYTYIDHDNIANILANNITSEIAHNICKMLAEPPW